MPFVQLIFSFQFYSSIKNKKLKKQGLELKCKQQRGQAVIFKGSKRKEKKREAYQQQTKPPSSICATLQKRRHDDTFNNTTKGYFWMRGGVACAV